METRRQRRRGGKSAQAVSSDPPVRPPSPASENSALPSPVSLTPGGLASTGDDLSGPDVEGVDLAEATATAEAPDPGAGPSDTQAVEVPSHMRVEQSVSIKTTNPPTLDSDTTHAQTLDEPSRVQVETRTHTLASRAEMPSLTQDSRSQCFKVVKTVKFSAIIGPLLLINKFTKLYNSIGISYKCRPSTVFVMLSLVPGFQD